MSLFKGVILKQKILKSIYFIKIPKRHYEFSIENHFGPTGFKLHLLDQGPSSTIELNREDALKYYRQMIELRKMEEKLASLYRDRKIRGFCHLSIGQEAITVGMNSVLRPQDTIITSYRCHGWALLKCNSMTEVIGETVGLLSGIGRGKGGSSHIYGKNFYGGNGIVGAQVPLGTGIAFAHKYMNSDAINVTLFGDGAANQGQVAEAYNFASLHKLPIIFVVENNYYGMGTAISRSSANPERYKSCTFIPGIRLNGNDILSVIEATKFAFQHIHDGKGPIILEMMTYRYAGHSMSDPGTSYRSREEIKEVREKKDACGQLRLLAVNSNLATEEDMKKIRDDVQEEVIQAATKALNSRPPPIEELTGDLYKNFTGAVRVPKMLTYVPHRLYGKWDESTK